MLLLPDYPMPIDFHSHYGALLGCITCGALCVLLGCITCGALCVLLGCITCGALCLGWTLRSLRSRRARVALRVLPRMALARCRPIPKAIDCVGCLRRALTPKAMGCLACL